jgi:hypothetical protein
MSKKVIRTIRLSEAVSPFGPGAVVDVLGESFMAVTGDAWPPAKLRTQVECERLASKLGVAELWAPPSTGDPDSPRTIGLEFVRFPSWLFCQECRRMTQWSRSREKGTTPQCPDCEGRLVPMRFVTVCTEKSHVADVPWSEWLHRVGGDGCKSRDSLRFQPSKGAHEGLSALEIACDACGTSRSLSELRSDVLQRDGFTCHGTQPWEHTWKGCGKALDVQQRGATSLHYGETVSAIDIPEVDGRAQELAEQIQRHPYFMALVDDPNSPIADAVVLEISSKLGCPPGTVRALLAVGNSGSPQLRTARGSLLAEEFEAFIAAIAGTAPTEDFVTRIESIDDGDSPALADLRTHIGEIVLVDRLREVRASMGFVRYRPDLELIRSVPLNPNEARWLPAVEGYGEGVFIRLNGDSVDEWAGADPVAKRAARITANQETSVLGSRLHLSSPQYILLHSFSHALMTELAFKSGYTAPSLRERIYCEADGDYGVFIYTTSTDIEGTLGGLVRQGEKPYLAQAVTRALEQIAWCPNDPVCSESDPQSIDGLNLSACHACMLAPETSCESSNLLLDRTMLVGGDGIPGFFQSTLEMIMNDAIAELS